MDSKQISQNAVSIATRHHVQIKSPYLTIQNTSLTNPIQKTAGPQAGNGFKISSTLTSTFMFVIVSCLLLTQVNCDCSLDPIVEKMYVDYQQYCTITYDPCNNNTLIGCSKQYCINPNEDCNILMQMTTPLGCRRYCCESFQVDANVNNPYSLQLCNSASSSSSVPNDSSSFVGGYVLIAIIGTTFVLIFIGFCICKKYQAQQANLTDPNNNNNPNAVLPPTCVDLNAYDINTQGPYFVNSNDSCAICLDNKVNLRTHCNHFYHGNCLLAWIKKKANNPCPLCMGTSYNPIKVYCQQCHSGDILVNIQPQTTNIIIKEYDTHKCENCKRFGNQSFTLSDEGKKYKIQDLSKNEIQKEQSQQVKEQNIEQTSIIQQTTSQKSRRRHRKVQSLRNLPEKQKKPNQNNQSENINSSAKRLHPNHNQTSIFP